MSELLEGFPAAEPPTPRASASAIVLRREGNGRWRPLLVVRSRRSRFMPGHLAFPGGGLEPEDGVCDDPLAWQRCADRELREETGLDLSDATWIPAGERTTPPMFPVRFRTKFYVVLAPHGWRPPDAPPTGEVEAFRWDEAREVVSDWADDRAKIPPPVLAILRSFADVAEASLQQLAVRVTEANAIEERAERIEFVRDVWVLPVRTETLPPASHTNVWMPGGRSFVVIDPGSAEEPEHRHLLEVVERRRALGHRPVAVVLTHGHRDHAAGAMRAAADLEVPLRAHPTVLADLGGADSATERIPIEDGEVLDLDGLSLRAIGTPGHEPGHLAFLIPERRALIAGDLVSGISTILIDPVHGDMQAYMNSLEKIAELNCDLLLPGHGPPLPGKAIGRLIDHRKRREQAILEQLSTAPADLDSIARGAYPELPDIPVELAGLQVLSNLSWLERQGRVERTDPSGKEWRLMTDTVRTIERLLRERLDPSHLEIRDDSAKHVGHAGATSGGGHYHVVIVSRAFEGQALLDRHRMVNEAVRDLFGERIHALGLTTLDPAAWEKRKSSGD